MVADLIESNGVLTDDQINIHYGQLLIEKGLAPGSPVAAAMLKDSEASADAELGLKLRTLSEMKGVNAIVHDQVIDFHDRVTILFGENGAGKTGYVRVIKLVANSRKAEAVIPNIKDVRRTPQEASIRYTLGSKEHTLAWKGERGLEPLTRIDIFDSRATAIYLDDELSFSYVPRELALFPCVRDALGRIKNKLQETDTANAPTENPFPDSFTTGTEAHGAVSGLNAKSDISAIGALDTTSPTDLEAVTVLEKHVAILRANTNSATIEVATQEKAFLNSTNIACEPFANMDRAAYANELKMVGLAKADYDAATSKNFEAQEIPGVLQDAWSEFVQAGEAYREATQLPSEVRIGDKCIYCRQPLAEAAAQLLAKYHDYCGASRGPLDAAKGKLSARVSACQKSDLLAVRRLLDQRVTRATDDGKELSPLHSRILVAVGQCEASLAASNDEKEWVAVSDVLIQVLKEIPADVATLEGQIADMKLEGESRSATLKTEAQKLAELKDRITLAAELPKIVTHVEKLRWHETAQSTLKEFTVLAKQLTDATKEASELVLTSDFQRNFEAECAALSAPPVRVVFPGSDAKTARRKIISDAHKLSDILSEGEQRAVALADFLAEASLRVSHSPIIFDDPVNSMDHRRITHVAQRIVELSESRQVVVFTHNIWLVAGLLDRLEKEVAYFDVEARGDQHGIITKGTTPRLDTLKQLRGKINDRLGRAKSQSGEEQFESLEKVYDYMRSFSEVFVETEVLKSVSGRFQERVMLTRLPQIRVEKLAEVIGIVLPIYERCCGDIASHSKPIEKSGIRPVFSNVDKDWNDLQAAWALLA